MHVQFFEQDELLAELDYEPSLNKVSNYVCYTTKPLSKPFEDFTPDGNLLMDFFEWRCWDRRRPDIDHILHFIGLHDYDPLTIVLKTHGLKHCDYLRLSLSHLAAHLKNRWPHCRNIFLGITMSLSV